MMLHHILSEILIGISLMLCNTAHLHGGSGLIVSQSSPVKICEKNVPECKHRIIASATTITTTSTITTRTRTSTSVFHMKESVTTIALTTPGKIIPTTKTSRLASTLKSSSTFVPQKPLQSTTDKTHTGGHSEEVINSIIVQKDNLVKKIISMGELICSFEEELHTVGSDPVCDRAEWKISANPTSLGLSNNDNNSPKRYKRDIEMGQRAPLTDEELQKLQSLYGRQQFNREAAERVKAMGMAEKERSWYNNNHDHDADDDYNYPPENGLEQNPHQQSSNSEQQQQSNNVLASKKEFYWRNSRRRREEESLGQQRQRQYNGRLSMGGDAITNNNNDDSNSNHDVINDNSDTPKDWDTKSKPELKFLLKSLLEKLDEPEQPTKEPIEELDAEEECSLYGTWLSPKVGVAIHLRPVGEIISVTLENLPNMNVKNQLVDSTWVGSVMISPVSPTTVTILFQEGQPVNPVRIEDSPETAVFVGQCVYCKGGNSIQGTWVLFSKKERQCSPGLTTTTTNNESQVNPSTFERLHRRSHG